MRYFLLILGCVVVAVLSFAGVRGGLSRRPPLEIFPDMKRQAKLRPQTAAPFFSDKMSSRPPVPGTIARGTPYENNEVNTGFRPGTTNFVENIPVPVTAELLARGKSRYQINCLPCHSPVGDGNGVVTKYGMIRAGNYHDPRLVKMTDGELFNTISNGKNLMAAYASQVSITDRWAIISYVRALQRCRLGVVEDVPEPQRAALK